MLKFLKIETLKDYFKIKNLELKILMRSIRNTALRQIGLATALNQNGLGVDCYR